MRETLPNKDLYRKNVALISLRESSFLLVNLNAWPSGYWKFPQGGVNPQETLEQAAEREFTEELGSNKIKILKKSNIIRRYKWENPIRIGDVEYVGQDQTFFIVEFFGNNDELQVQAEEIREFCWVKPQELKSIIARPELDFLDYWKTISKILFEQQSFLRRKGIVFES